MQFLFTTCFAHTASHPAANRSLDRALCAYAQFLEDCGGVNLPKLGLDYMHRAMEEFSEQELRQLEVELIGECQRLDAQLQKYQKHPTFAASVLAREAYLSTANAQEQMEQLFHTSLDYQLDKCFTTFVSSTMQLLRQRLSNAESREMTWQETRTSIAMAKAEGCLYTGQAFVSKHDKYLDFLSKPTVDALLANARTRLQACRHAIILNS